MPGPNSEPIFSRVADVQWEESIVTANNTIDLTSGTSYEVFVADATNGGFVRNARVKVNPANNSAATVVRFWLNNGSTTGTSANSALIGELGLPATTASASAPQADFDYGLNMALAPGHKIYVTVGTAPGGSAELTVTIFGGKY
jgi:predicted Zn-dependent protease